MGSKSLNLRTRRSFRGGAMYMTNRDKVKFNNQFKFAPTNTVQPVISGIGTVGQVITSTTGTWTGDAPITYSYQWSADGENIGADQNTYTVLIGDSGKDIMCTISATDVNGTRPRISNVITVA